MEAMRAAPIAAGTNIFDVTTLQGYILGQLKSTVGWSAMAEILAGLLYGSDEQRGAVVEARGVRRYPAEQLGNDGGADWHP